MRYRVVAVIILAGLFGAALAATGVVGAGARTTAFGIRTETCEYGVDQYGQCLPPPPPPSGCQYGTDQYGQCLPPPPPPPGCQYGTDQYGQCLPPPPPPSGCQYGTDQYGQCLPPPPPPPGCQYGTDQYGQCLPPPAPPAQGITINEVTAGQLLVVDDDGDAITISCPSGNVLVNGADPTTGPAACNTISSIQVQGGPGDNVITGNDLTTAKFPLLPTFPSSGGNGVYFHGGDGNDTLTAPTATVSVTLYGDSGNDALTAGNADDFLDGDGPSCGLCGAGEPPIGPVAPIGNDTMSGGTGRDSIDSYGSGSGADDIDGNEGADTITVHLGHPMSVSVHDSGTPGTDFNDFARRDTLIAYGTAGDDTIEANSSQITYGVDELINFTGIEDPELWGRDGDDTLDASAATSTTVLEGQNGADTLTGGSALDVIVDDICSTCESTYVPGVDNIDGGGGQDEIVLLAGSDVVDGQGGGDYYEISTNELLGTESPQINDSGTGGFDFVHLSGPDTADSASIVGGTLTWGTLTLGTSGVEQMVLQGNGGDDSLDGSAANLLLTLDGGAGTDTVRGGSANDNLTGDTFPCFSGCTPPPAPADDNVYGGGGNDYILSGGGHDNLDGQGAGDTYNLRLGSPLDVNITDSGPPPPPGPPTPFSAESDQIYLTGTSGPDVLTVNPGSIGHVGDTITFSNVDLVLFYGTTGNDSVNGAAADLPLWLNGDAGGDTLTGGTADDHLFAGDDLGVADDTLTGGGGRDTLSSGGGTDSLNGGGDGDTYFVTLGNLGNTTVTDSGTPPSGPSDWPNRDMLNIGGTNSGDAINITDGQTSLGPMTVTYDATIDDVDVNGNDGDDTLDATAAAARRFQLEGGNGADTLRGGPQADTLYDGDYTGSSTDLLYGGGGSDYLSSRAGADVLDGQNGSDTGNVDLSTGLAAASVVDTGADAGPDSIVGSGSFVTADNITVTNTAITSGTATGSYSSDIEGVRIFAGGGHDSVDASGATRAVSEYGGDGNDTLIGGSGNDLLVGEAGNDTMLGGAGSDSIEIGGDSDPNVDGQDGSDHYQIVFDAYYGTLGTATQTDSGTIGSDDMHFACDAAVVVTATQVTRGAQVVNYAGLESTPTCVAPPPPAGVFVDAANVLHVNLDTANITVTCVGLNVKVNGNDPDSGPAMCTSLTYIEVFAGGSANTIDLSTVTSGAFSGLPAMSGPTAGTATLVFGGGGNDHVLGSSLNDSIAGNGGNDVLEGLAGDDGLFGDDSCGSCPPPGNDTLTGGDGNDYLVANGGTDSLDGQADGDFYDVDKGTANIADSAPDSAGGPWQLLDGLLAGGTSAGETITLSGAGPTLAINRSGMAVNGVSTIEDVTVAAGGGNDTVTAATATMPVGHTLNLLGEDGSDTLTGSSGPDRLNADDTCCSVPLNDGSDVLRGGGSDDLLIASGGGTDALDGQAGNDVLEADLGSGGLIKGYDASGATDTIQVWGTSGDDTITFANTTATGGGGAVGSAQWGGVEIVEGHGIDGNDQLNASTRSLPISLFGEGGNDVVTGGGVGDQLYGDWNGPADPFYAPPGDDTINGNAGPDILGGGEGNDLLNGGVGGDLQLGGIGTDTVTYSGRGAAVSASIGTGPISGQAGEGDTIDASVENLTGGNGGDTLTGDANANVLDGGVGNDTLMGKDGPDAIIGGAGIDTVSYADHSSDVTLTLGPGADGDGGGAEGDTVGVDMDNAVGGDGNDTLTGSDLVNAISGGVGNDQVYGLGSNDVLNGNVGDDTLNGGDGADVSSGGLGADTFSGGAGSGDQASYADHAVGVTVTVGNGVADDGSPGEGDNVQGDNEVVQGGPGPDTLTGSGSADILYGNGDNDTLDGLGGNDTLFGGAAHDILSGGDGIDKLDGGADGDNLNGGNGVDTASYSTRTNPVLVTIGAGANDDGELGEGDDVAADVENAAGGAAGDTLTGNGFANTLTGNGGDDVLSGGAGNDVVDGGLGADTFDGGGGTDAVTYASRTSGVTVTVGNGVADDGAPLEGDEVLGTIENVIGGTGSDDITGDGGANVLNGGGGGDTLTGGGAVDTLNGGAGADHLFSRGDAFADRVNCGTESDDGEADLADIVNADCEAVVKA